ncbi:MAG: glycosyltransferase family 2 protein [Nitrospiraceae bacterium]
MRTAVIVPTYNRPDALEVVLRGYSIQDDRDFEMIVADDGSTEDTRRLVDRLRAQMPFPITHVWQEDRGFRLAAVRNRAVAAAQADYIIFTDGDCIPSSRFVSAHKQLAERGYFLAANRMLLSQRLTQEILRERLVPSTWGWLDWSRARLHRDVDKLLPLVVLPDGAFRRLSSHRWQGLKTCNLSLWREDLVRVNGLDESYQGWGLDDSDLVVRLFHAGVRHKSARFAAPVFHLWHTENDRSCYQKNQEHFAEVLRTRAVRATAGLDQYLIP